MEWRYGYSILVLGFLANFSTIVARLVISPLIPDIIDAFDVSKAIIGIALTVMWAVYALMQYPSGILSERYGERATIITAIGLTAVGSILLSLAPSFQLFVIFSIFLGLGAGLYFAVGTSLLSRMFEQKGMAFGFHSAGGPLGGVIAPISAAYIGSRYGWRYGIALGAAISFPVVILMVWRIRSTIPRNPTISFRDRLNLSTIIELLSRPGIAFTTVIATFATFAWQSYASFFPTFLIEVHGISSGKASVVFGSSFVLMAIGLPIVGFLSDLLGRDTTLSVSMLTAALGLSLLVIGRSTSTLFAGTLVFGLGAAWAGVLQSRFMDRLDKDERSMGFGLVRTAYLLPASLGSAVTGVLAELEGWSTAYGIIIGILIIGGVAVAGNRIFEFGL